MSIKYNNLKPTTITFMQINSFVLKSKSICGATLERQSTHLAQASNFLDNCLDHHQFLVL